MCLCASLDYMACCAAHQFTLDFDKAAIKPPPHILLFLINRKLKTPNDKSFGAYALQFFF